MRAVLAEVIAPPAGDCVFAAHEGALHVHTDLARQAWARMGRALVYIYLKNTVRFSVKPSSTNFHSPPGSRVILMQTLSSPVQLPDASSRKPAGHVFSL